MLSIGEKVIINDNPVHFNGNGNGLTTKEAIGEVATVIDGPLYDEFSYYLVETESGKQLALQEFELDKVIDIGA